MTAPANIQLARPFSVPQLAHRWGCSEGLIRKMIRDGRLQCFRPGTLIRISAAEVERFECQQQAMMTPTASIAADCDVRFGIEIPDADVAEWETVADVAGTVARLTQQTEVV